MDLLFVRGVLFCKWNTRTLRARQRKRRRRSSFFAKRCAESFVKGVYGNADEFRFRKSGEEGPGNRSYSRAVESLRAREREAKSRKKSSGGRGEREKEPGARMLATPAADNTVSACICAIACMQACIFDRGGTTMALQRRRVTHIAIYAGIRNVKFNARMHIANCPFCNCTLLYR